MKALTIKTNGDIQIVEFSPVNGSSLEFLQEAVGGMIECVALSSTVDMWVNEEGKYNGAEFNPKATALWESVYGATDVMMGDVVLTGGCDDDGVTLGLAQEDVSNLLEVLALAGH